MCIDKPSPNVKPESHNPPPLSAREVKDNVPGAEERQGVTSLRNPWVLPIICDN
jgi:hypothetical protein